MPPRLKLGKAEVALPPGGFLQATALGEETLARLVIEGAGQVEERGRPVLRHRPLRLPPRRARARSRPIDNDRAAIAALNAAAKVTSGLKPLTAAARDLFREPLVPNEMKELRRRGLRPAARRCRGAGQAAGAISKVKTVVAVSCDAGTFARDAEILVGGGYALKTVTAVDQFKWSSHVEIVALFTR